MGPNDASGVVWAIGEFLMISFMFFYILINVLFTYSRNIWSMGAGRLEMTRTGANVPFAPLFFFFCTVAIKSIRQSWVTGLPNLRKGHRCHRSQSQVTNPFFGPQKWLPKAPRLQKVAPGIFLAIKMAHIYIQKLKIIILIYYWCWNTMTKFFGWSQLNSAPDETIILSGRSQVTLGDKLV